MNIKNDDTRGVSRLDLEQTSGARQTGRATSNPVPEGQTSPSDSIALSITNDIVQQALSSGAAARASRIAELKHLVQTNQYPVDAAAVSKALIEAHLRGD
jgi:anti-sigma28 factor (negative regulator of flagellin synthesis)